MTLITLRSERVNRDRGEGAGNNGGSGVVQAAVENGIQIPKGGKLRWDGGLGEDWKSRALSLTHSDRRPSLYSLILVATTPRVRDAYA